MNLSTLTSVDLPFLGTKSSGKVRDIYQHGDHLILITTDRLSAFDHILGAVPHKGQVLNQLAAFWFAQTAQIVPNHFVSMPDPNVTVARKCHPLPVEVVVRGYITGVTETALWRRYSQGEREIYGMRFPDGLQKNDPLPAPIITPTTKGSAGGHDLRITSAEVVQMGLVDARRWEEVCAAALAVFQRGQAIAQQAGLILVDTKYEFGISPDGDLMLIDEVHTPDSSRFWLGESYERIRQSGSQSEPENLDKEYVRLAYARQGYRGDGNPPPLSDALASELSQRYQRAYELLTGQPFLPAEEPAAARIERNLRVWRVESGKLKVES